MHAYMHAYMHMYAMLLDYVVGGMVTSFTEAACVRWLQAAPARTRYYPDTPPACLGHTHLLLPQRPQPPQPPHCPHCAHRHTTRTAGTTSAWVSTKRVGAGRGGTTHTYCDDEPVSWFVPAPTPQDPATATAAGVDCRDPGHTNAVEDRAAAAVEFGCRYQRNPWTDGRQHAQGLEAAGLPGGGA